MADVVADERKDDGSRKGLMGPPDRPAEEEPTGEGMPSCWWLIEMCPSPAAIPDEEEEGAAPMLVVAPIPTAVAADKATLG